MTTLLTAVSSSFIKRSLLLHPSSALTRNAAAATATSIPLARKYLSTKTKKNKTILLLGCNGALGSSIVSNKKSGCTIIGADISDPPSSSKIDQFIQIPSNIHHSIVELNKHLRKQVMKHTNELDGIVCACGGFETDPMPNENGNAISTHDYAMNFDKMLKANLYPIIVSSLIGMELLKKDGLFLTIGAADALDLSPNMAAYGMSKNANHFLVQTLGGAHLATKPHSSLTKAYGNGYCALSILPSILDTPQNRKDMPNANYDKWIKPNDVSNQIWEWISKPALRPNTGSLIQVIADKKNGTVFQLAR